jgi:excisionase family DNA binding protein
MNDVPTQLDMRENTGSSRQHASRLASNSSVPDTETLSGNAIEGNQLSLRMSPPAQIFNLPIIEAETGATGGERAATAIFAPGSTGRRAQSTVERPLTCEEAAELMRVHPRTVKRMARNRKLPGHFRFGRWFFFASELDCWMRTELHSSRHSCR